MPAKFVCPSCGSEDQEMIMGQDPERGRGPPAWTCVCGWEGTLRKFVAIIPETGLPAPASQYAKKTDAEVRAGAPVAQPFIVATVRPREPVDDFRDSCPAKCECCEEPLIIVWGADKYTITWDGKHWTKSEETSILVCSTCGEELNNNEDAIQDMMMGTGLL